MRGRLAGSAFTFPDRSEHPKSPSEPAPNKGIDSGKHTEDGTSRILAFSLEKIMSTKDTINKRNKEDTASEDCVAAISAFNCLSAILWKGITRARSQIVVAKTSRLWCLCLSAFERSLSRRSTTATTGTAASRHCFSGPEAEVASRREHYQGDGGGDKREPQRHERLADSGYHRCHQCDTRCSNAQQP